MDAITKIERILKFLSFHLEIEETKILNIRKSTTYKNYDYIVEIFFKSLEKTNIAKLERILDKIFEKEKVSFEIGRYI